MYLHKLKNIESYRKMTFRFIELQDVVHIVYSYHLR